jgi:hypothetical protein
VFEPRREHARFCSPRCRVASNRENINGQWAGDSALGWAIIAMRDTAHRLGRIRSKDRPQAFAVIGEAVWWVTIVDATLVRYHSEAYDNALAGQAHDERQATEGTFAGLRFIRNQMGYHADHADFIHPRRTAGGSQDVPVAAWTWKPVPEPALGWLLPRGQEWAMTRYRAYQAHLAGHTIGETFGRAEAFLQLASATAGAAPDLSTPAAS